MRRELAEWAQQAHDLSQRRAAGLIPVDRATLRYEHHRDPQDALRVRLRELAGSRVRYGYRRLDLPPFSQPLITGVSRFLTRPGKPSQNELEISACVVRLVPVWRARMQLM